MKNVSNHTGAPVTWLQDVAPDELRRIIDALHRVHQFLACMTDLDALLERIMVESKAVANADACSLMLYDADTDELYFQVALGEHGDQQVLKKEIRLKRGQGIAGTAAVERRSINVEDAQHDARFFRSADAVSQFYSRSILAVPLVDRDQLIGVVEVLNKRDGGAFTEADLHVMEIFSSAAATAISNARLIEENLRAERLAAIGQAVAGLSHYANNLITGLGGSIDLIENAINRDDRESLSRAWPILRRSCQRLSNFVEDMLAYSKPREPVIEDCDVPALFEEAVETIQMLMARKQVEIAVDITDLDAPFPLDNRGFFRCMLNLLKNAVDAAPLTEGRIWLTAQREAEGNLVIEVGDNGPGVPQELRHRIWEPFYSSKGTQGTGLGLAVTQKIVEEHDGVLEIDDRPGGGALFRIKFPAVRKDE